MGLTKKQKEERDALLMKDAKEVYRSKRLNQNYCSKTADDWIEYFKGLKEAFADKKDVVFSIETTYEYGNEPDLVAEYKELETPAEVSARLKREKDQEDWDRKQFEKLKKKFGE